MLELAESPAFHLSDPFFWYPKNSANIQEWLAFTIMNSKAESDYLPLSRTKNAEEVTHVPSHQLLGCRDFRNFDPRICCNFLRALTGDEMLECVLIYTQVMARIAQPQKYMPSQLFVIQVIQYKMQMKHMLRPTNCTYAPNCLWFKSLTHSSTHKSCGSKIWNTHEAHASPISL